MAEQSNKTVAAPRRLWLWTAGAVLALAVAGGLVWRGLADDAARITVETATLAPATRVLAVNGQLAALRSVAVRAAVTAEILTVQVTEGDAVAAGAVLADLDATQAQAVVRQARAALESGLLAQAQAAATYGRTRDLGSNVARTRLEDDARALETASQEVGRLTALLQQAEIQAARYAIKAPISGTVMQRSVDPGQLVDPATPLFTLADLSTLVVETDVDEAYATQIKLGLAAAMQLVGTSDTLSGRVVFVAPRVDPATGGLAVKIGFDAPLSAPVGLTVTANIVVDARDAALTVPRTALVATGADWSVLVLDGKTLRRRAVKVIDWPAARLIVTEGLAAGDRIAVDASGLTDGQSVEVAP